MRSVEAATRTRTLVPSSSWIFILRRFGRERFLVLLFAWLTLLPTIGPFPVNTHFLDILATFLSEIKPAIIQKYRKVLLKCVSFAAVRA